MYDLYILHTCPYSQKVMNFMDDKKIKYKTHDITDLKEKQELLKLGGKEQVPFLYDSENNVKMYESDDIINYLAVKNVLY